MEIKPNPSPRPAPAQATATMVDKVSGDKSSSDIPVAAPRTGDGYEVNLSDRARKLKNAKEKAMQMAKDTPAVRDDKVQHYKDLIAKGQYPIDSGKIADGMLKEAVREQLANEEPTI